MVFPSVPVYLDPHNWQQHQSGGESENNQLLSPPVLPPPTTVGGGSTGIGTIRPGSMVERAKMARLPQPETALKCPRCESTNTKFCYFNNYSLTQPRHFCKTCRRYWTRGGALRNVPVGGGCRRNKRSKGGNRSKSPNVTGSTSTSAAVHSNSCTNSTDHMNMIGHFLPAPQRLPFLPSLPHLRDYGCSDIGLNFTGIEPPLAAAGGGVNVGANMEFQIGTSSGGGGGGGQWRLQQMHQFPFLAGLEPPSGIYPFEGEGVDLSCYTGSTTAHLLGSKPLDSGTTQMTNVKVEENNQGLNLSRNVLGIQGNDQYNWGGNAWTDLSGFTSSTSHLL